MKATKDMAMVIEQTPHEIMRLMYVSRFIDLRIIKIQAKPAINEVSKEIKHFIGL